MGFRQWLVNYKFLGIAVLIATLLGVTVVGVVNRPIPLVSPVSPLRAQAVEEEFDNLDGAGEIEWYEEDFFVWNPQAQVTSYPFITGTIYIHWDDADTGLMPISLPYTSTALVVELELRGTKTYTQKIDTGFYGATEPDTGVFGNVIWIWIDNESGVYDEHIKAYWIVGNETIPLQLVSGGQVIQPQDGFALYRENLIIPELIYLPIVMKAAR